MMSGQSGTPMHKIVYDTLLDGRQPGFCKDREAYLALLRQADPRIWALLTESSSLEQARERVHAFLWQEERTLFEGEDDILPLEAVAIRNCIQALRAIFAPRNEARTQVSALDCLWRISHDQQDELTRSATCAFLMEIIQLLLGLTGQSGIYEAEHEVEEPLPDLHQMTGRQAAHWRSRVLDRMAEQMQGYLERYVSGLEPEVVHRREDRRRRILEVLNAPQERWWDHRWHLQNIIKGPQILRHLLDLTPEEEQAIELAVKARIPFGITPYYLSLMDPDRRGGLDRAVRAQVIPTMDYMRHMASHRADRSVAFDFMGEQDTSPVDGITRRYPGIAILKPFNTCAQICVYCQRNWEIDECMAPHAMVSEESLAEAIAWLEAHPAVGEVLVTGGDPMVMSGASIAKLLHRLSEIDHIYRIRIGTRTPVVLPMRWTEELVELLGRFKVPGRREVAVVTHFEHPYEITPEAMEAVRRIRLQGISVYNQEVFTRYNSRRFESCKLRLLLRSIGVDPYYTFNTKGKEETRSYSVPVARILQERKEEARLLPGLDRTDEPVFNVPRLGKNHLRAWQDHRLIMILPDGRRVYSFHPWEKNITHAPAYIFEDIPLLEYLDALAGMGEDVRDYRTIWYYF